MSYRKKEHGKMVDWRNTYQFGSKTITKEPKLKLRNTSHRHHGDQKEEKTQDSGTHTSNLR
jgi:hypothetical protein